MSVKKRILVGISSLVLTTVGFSCQAAKNEMMKPMKETTKQNDNMNSKQMNSEGKQNTKMEDSAITKEVNKKLKADNSLSSTHVTVTTQQGVVSLSGDVKTEAQASKAVEIASSVDGVSDVDTSNLTVKEKSSQPFADTFITAKVKGALIKEKLFGTQPVGFIGVTVSTTNGVVSLSGTVDSQEEAQNAESIAKSVAGVQSVQSSLTVNPESANQSSGATDEGSNAKDAAQ